MTALTQARMLTIKQPWASAIAFGHKDIENRDWSTEYRGPVIIHAGLNTDQHAYGQHPLEFSQIPPLHVLPTGVMIAVVDLVDITRDSTSPWAQPDKFHWHLANPRHLTEHIPYRGSLGLTWLTDDALALVNDALAIEGGSVE